MLSTYTHLYSVTMDPRFTLDIDSLAIDSSDDFFETLTTTQRHSTPLVTTKTKATDVRASGEDKARVESTSIKTLGHETSSLNCNVVEEEADKTVLGSVDKSSTADAGRLELDSSRENIHQDATPLSANTTDPQNTPLTHRVSKSKQNTVKYSSSDAPPSINSESINKSNNDSIQDMECSNRLRDICDAGIYHKLTTPTSSPHTYKYNKYTLGEGPSVGRADGYLSPWERWVLQKAHREKERRHKRRLSKVMLKEQELEKIDKDRQKEINAKKCYDEWVTKKLALERERTNNQQRKIAEKEAEEKEKLEHLNSKASSSFREWQLIKLKQKKEEKEKRLREARQKEQKESVQKAKAEEAYRRWLIAAGRRRIDKEFCAGRRDSPSYCNPNSWRGPLDNS